jgi:hypothetical protein
VLAAAFAASVAQAQAPLSQEGPFVALAVGQTQYDYDCYFFDNCENARATPVKLGAGYRFGGVFALEAWYSDFGKAKFMQARGSLRVNSLGLFGAWHLRFSPTVQGLLRVGGVRVNQGRSDEPGNTTFEGGFGLGLLVDVTPQAALEFAWDLSTAMGSNSGSTVVNAVTAGLRLRF